MKLEYNGGEVWDTETNEYLGECAGDRFVPSKVLLERPPMHHRVVENFAKAYLTTTEGERKPYKHPLDNLPAGILIWALLFDLAMLIIGLLVGWWNNRLWFGVAVAGVPGGLVLLLGVALYFQLTRPAKK